jgi:hypothetical protein
MQILCTRNFLANGVAGFPGKTLSTHEVETVKPVLAQLEREGLVMRTDAGPVKTAEPLPEPVAEPVAEPEAPAKAEAFSSKKKGKRG